MSAPPALPFGRTAGGQEATLYTLENETIRVRIIDWGGRIVSIEIPDRTGNRAEITLGFDEVGMYEAAGGAFGALLGRTANRIAGGDLTIDGRWYRLAINDRGATLHGGPGGFHSVLWRAAGGADGAFPSLVLSHVSPDGDQGFPGEVAVTAVYRLAGETLWLAFTAQTTAPTVLSLSAHPYFNLGGAAHGDILDHILEIASEAFLPTDEVQIPTGEIRSVAETPFDFRVPTPIGARIRRSDPQLLHGQGYDHCFVLAAKGEARVAARVEHPASGRTIEIVTTHPGLQFYSGNQLNGTVVGRGGVIYRQSAGFALEPQGFPDAAHHAQFPSTVLRPGERYHATIGYRFGLA
ncbi:MAG: galactose mutarotase [Rhodospirillales bacterium]|nr:galactose mutarotase [Rhodospirillales bacterium]